jgi:low affinity Fe/Cu permease
MGAALMFDRFARQTAHLAGSSWAFMAALGSIILWAVAGPIFGWSNSWQLVANTGTTIVTFWMVFVIQHAQNVDTAEIKALLREIAEDLPEVDDRRAQQRAQDDDS